MDPPYLFSTVGVEPEWVCAIGNRVADEWDPVEYQRRLCFAPREHLPDEVGAHREEQCTQGVSHCPQSSTGAGQAILMALIVVERHFRRW